MQEFVEYIVKNLVENPNDVSVECVQSDSEVHIKIRVSSDDVGKVVGKQGKTINALRCISNSIGARLGYRLRLELLQ